MQYSTNLLGYRDFQMILMVLIFLEIRSISQLCCSLSVVTISDFMSESNTIVLFVRWFVCSIKKL